MHLLPQIQRRVEECEASRKRLEERREDRQLETYQRRQHKLKLRQQAKVMSFGDNAYCLVNIAVGVVKPSSIIEGCAGGPGGA